MDKLEQEFGEVFSNLGASMQNIKIPTDKEGITSVINANPQLKQVLQKLRGQEKQSPQPLNEEVSVILVLGILLAAPKIIELIVGAVNKVINSGRMFTKIKKLNTFALLSKSPVSILSVNKLNNCLSVIFLFF
jgi:hypothetical protein